MKISAAILILVSLVYFTETVLVPGKMALCCAAQNCPGSVCKAAVHSCSSQGSDDCASRSHNTVCQRHAHDTPSHRNSPEKSRPFSCDPANCPNCPLCYTATLAAFYSPVFTPAVNTLDYPELIPGQVSDYYSQSWKPPDPRPFHQDFI